MTAMRGTEYVVRMEGGKVVTLGGGFGGVGAARTVKDADAITWTSVGFAHERLGRITVPTENTA